MARVIDYSSEVSLDVEVCPLMPRAKSKVVSEATDPIPLDKSGFGGLTMANMYRVFPEIKTSHFDQRLEDVEEENSNTQRLT